MSRSFKNIQNSIGLEPTNHGAATKSTDLIQVAAALRFLLFQLPNNKIFCNENFLKIDLKAPLHPKEFYLSSRQVRYFTFRSKMFSGIHHCPRSKRSSLCYTAVSLHFTVRFIAEWKISQEFNSSHFSVALGVFTTNDKTLKRWHTGRDVEVKYPRKLEQVPIKTKWLSCNCYKLHTPIVYPLFLILKIFLGITKNVNLCMCVYVKLKMSFISLK